MPSSKSNGQIAELLLGHQVDRTVLDEAARRLQQTELHWLTTLNEIITAVKASPLIGPSAAYQVEMISANILMSRIHPERIESIAGRILSGRPYDDQDVRSLAGLLLSKADV